MVMPLIDQLPPAPSPGDVEDVFDDKAYDFAAAMERFGEQANTLALAVESEAGRSKTEADRSQSQVSAATTEANRSKTEADRARSEASRAQQAADDAVAITTGGTASIDPAAGKIPIAGADAAIQQAWIKDLEFELDRLRVATNKTLYGDGPYPIIDLQFQGAKYLDPQVEFTRASAAWDENGKEYEVNEPILTDKGLQWFQRRTNFIAKSNPVRNGFSWRVGDGAVVLSENAENPLGGGGALQVEGLYGTGNSNSGSSLRYFLNQTYQGEGVHRLSFYAKSSVDREKMSLRAFLSNGESRYYGFNLSDISSEEGYLSREYKRYTSLIDVEGIASLIFDFQNSTSIKTLWGFQLEKSEFTTPLIPTTGAQVTVARDAVDGNIIVPPRKHGFSVLTEVLLLTKGLELRQPILLLTNPEYARLIGIQQMGISPFRYAYDGPQALDKTGMSVPPSQGQAVKVGISVSAGRICFFVNGQMDFLEVSNNEIINQLVIPENQMIFGGGAGLNRQARVIKRISYYDQLLSDAKMMELTAL